MTDWFATEFCSSAGVCGWQYLGHYFARAGFHLVLVDPMLAVVFLAGWTLLADRGFAPKRRGYGFLTWVWLTAWAASFLREPVDSATTDWIGKSYFDALTHAVGIWFWIEVIMRLGPRLHTCAVACARQRRNMRRRRA